MTLVALAFAKHTFPSKHPSDRFVKSIMFFKVLHQANGGMFKGLSAIGVGAGNPPPGIGGVGGLSFESLDRSNIGHAFWWPTLNEKLKKWRIEN